MGTLQKYVQREYISTFIKKKKKQKKKNVHSWLSDTRTDWSISTLNYILEEEHVYAIIIIRGR